MPGLCRFLFNVFVLSQSSDCGISVKCSLKNTTTTRANLLRKEMIFILKSDSALVFFNLNIKLVKLSKPKETGLTTNNINNFQSTNDKYLYLRITVKSKAKRISIDIFFVNTI